LLSIVVVVAAFLIASAKDVFDYAAAPDKPKESDFVFPYNPNQEKPFAQVIKPGEAPALQRENHALRRDHEQAIDSGLRFGGEARIYSGGL
jgi:hypothetical protein